MTAPNRSNRDRYELDARSYLSKLWFQRLNQINPDGRPIWLRRWNQTLELYDLASNSYR